MTTINVKKPEQILSEKASLEIKEAVEKAMYSNECELIKSHLLWQPADSSLVDDGGLFLDSLMYMYFVNTPGLTKSQEVLNKELLGIILNTVQAPCPDSDEENNYTTKLAEFLEKHKKNPDLKTVLDLKNPNYGLEIGYNIKKKNRKSASYTITNPCITESLLIPIAGRKVLNISNLQISEVKMILCY